MTTYFERYEDSLIDSGYPNAVPLSNGIWAGEKAYHFDDEVTNTIITIKKIRMDFISATHQNDMDELD